MAKTSPVDPLQSAQYGLKGTIVTMTADDGIVDGTLYVKDARIEAIIRDGTPVPGTLASWPVYNTKGTIFPGLIELHNHLSYNCLPLWDVPKQYSNRNQWSGIPEYQQRISFPMNILGKTKGYVEAIVRYVECKCLAGGVTTSQGIMLFSNAGIKKYYRGIVRNVEDTGDIALPHADAHIPDIAAHDVNRFFSHLQKSTCLLLHLSEGRDAPAHSHFEALRMNGTDWAITPALAGIHCVALTAADYKVMQQKGASMVWSPFSNLLLYGQTANVKAAKESGITMALGSDWSPSGSKNLLGELKVAKLYSDANGKLFSNYELVCMATKNAARIIKWDKELGTLEKGKRADLLVIDRQHKDPYNSLLTASEKAISLVVINGTPRLGNTTVMNKLGVKGEQRTIGGEARLFNLQQNTQDPVVGKLTLAQAEEQLKDGLSNIKKLATHTAPLHRVISAKGGRFLLPLTAAQKNAAPEWVLVLDHDEDEGEPQRPHFHEQGQPAITMKKIAPMALDPDVLIPIQLDALTVAEDKMYFKRIETQKNLPDYIKTKLKELYADLKPG